MLRTWKCLVDDMDFYESCMHSTKIIYVNSFSRGFHSKISHVLFLTNSEENHFAWVYTHQIWQSRDCIFLKGKLKYYHIFDRALKPSKIFGFLTFSRDKKKKVLPDVGQFAFYISLFLFDPWTHQEITLAQLLRKSKEQLQGTGKRRKHGKEGNSARIYFHSRNLKIHKNFAYLKLSHIKYCLVLLKHKRSKNGT